MTWRLGLMMDREWIIDGRRPSTGSHFSVATASLKIAI
jgi:hypothetical protein